MEKKHKYTEKETELCRRFFPEWLTEEERNPPKKKSKELTEYQKYIDKLVDSL